MKYTAVDFWEDHCVECGESACFRSCEWFLRSDTGRCSRIDTRDDGWIKLRHWGKLELLWHGGLADEITAKKLCEWNRRWEARARKWQRRLQWVKVPYGRGPYGIFRSIRWRKAKKAAKIAKAPNKWIFEAKAEATTVLIMEVRDESRRVLTAKRIELTVEMQTFEMMLPMQLRAGTLFSLRTSDGSESGWIKIGRMEIGYEEQREALVKCVAWDLDDTVWEGTLAEGDKLRLNPGIKEQMLALEARGVVNSVISKNDYQSAIAVLKHFGLEELIVFPQISWGAKSLALRNLSKEMNISLGAIALIDDNEHERAEVERELPMVRTFARLGESEQYGIDNGLGAERRRYYREEMQRRVLVRSEFDGDAEAFLKASELKVELSKITGANRDRCKELVNRTNQLTISGRRYGEQDFEDLLIRCESRAVSASDKYGDYGVVGFVAWSATKVEELVFSCRIAAKGVEERVLATLPWGIEIPVVVTEKNKPIRDIIEKWQREHGNAGDGYRPSIRRKLTGWIVAKVYWALGIRYRMIRRIKREGKILPIVFHAATANEVSKTLSWLKKAGILSQVEITFDDGWKELKPTIKVLQDFKVEATVFIAPGQTIKGRIWTDGIDIKTRQRLYPLTENERDLELKKLGVDTRRRILNEDEIRSIAKLHNIQIGNHTWSHLSATSLPEDEVVAEIRRAQEVLSEWCGYEPKRLAWPFGRGNAQLDLKVRAMGLIPYYTRQGLVDEATRGACRNMFYEGMTLSENLGRITMAWPKVGETL